MSIPDGILGRDLFVLASDRPATHFSDAERELAERAACYTTPSGGRRSLRTALKTLWHHPVDRLVIVGSVHSRALAYRRDQAEHAGINIVYS